MAKYAGKNAIILLNGYNLSTYSSSFEVEHDAGAIDVTGFTDGCKNFIPGMQSASIRADMYWSSTAGAVHTALGGATPATGIVTILPEGWAVGKPTMSLPFMQGNYNPKGAPADALTVGTLNFLSYGANVGIEYGIALQHATITNTTTTTAYEWADDAVTDACAGVLHVWSSCAADTYVVKIQHCATADGAYADLVTFTLTGAAVNAERVTVASGTINKYLKVVATRTGSAGNSFGYSVHFARI